MALSSLLVQMTTAGDLLRSCGPVSIMNTISTLKAAFNSFFTVKAAMNTFSEHLFYRASI
jgi:hypothetical protein